MNQSDKDKIIEIMFDPITSGILAELENGKKESSYLATKSNVTEKEVRERLDYLIKYDFVLEKKINGKLVYEASGEKLAQLMDGDENFNLAIDGLTKMDSYLN